MKELSKIILILIPSFILSYMTFHKVYDLKIEDVKKWILNRRIYKIVVDNVNQRILESNVQYYFRHYNLLIHYVIGLSIAIIIYFFLGNYPFSYRLIVSFIGMSMPALCIQLVKVKTTALTERQAITLITSFKTNYRLYGNIFDTFKTLEETLTYPLLEPVKRMNAKYFEFSLDAEECLIDFKRSFADERIKEFVDQLVVSHDTGGNVIAICDNFLKDFNRKNRAETNDRINEFIDRYLMFILIVMSLTLIHHVFDQKEFIVFVTENIYGKMTLFSTYGLIYFMIYKLIKTS